MDKSSNTKITMMSELVKGQIWHFELLFSCCLQRAALPVQFAWLVNIVCIVVHLVTAYGFRDDISEATKRTISERLTDWKRKLTYHILKFHALLQRVAEYHYSVKSFRVRVKKRNFLLYSAGSSSFRDGTLMAWFASFVLIYWEK